MKLLLIVLSLWLIGCSNSQEEPEKLCLNFIKLNRKKSFDLLYKTSTIGLRTSSHYDDKSGQNILLFNMIAAYCKHDSVVGDYITISTDEVAFKQRKYKYYKSNLFYECINETGGNTYETFIKKFWKEYNSINVPKENNYQNILFEGNPRLGQFIKFELNKRCTVFYLRDYSSLEDSYWKKHFNQIKKVNNEWYYEIHQIDG